MSWKVVQRNNFDQLKNLILKQEWPYVSFSDWFRKIVKNKIKYKYECIILGHYTHATIREAILLTRNGLILPLLEKTQLQWLDYKKYMFLSSMTKYMTRIHSIMGLYTDVEKIKSVLTKKASTDIDYYIMTLTKHNLVTPAVCITPAKSDSHHFSVNGFLIKKAKPIDCEKLYTLQKEYELEEVFINPARFKSKVCFSNLKKMLKEEFIFYAEKNGIPIAKAQTNARGFYGDQIGGVYTMMNERRKGTALCLMYLLLRQIFMRKSIASLFVKKKNTPAIELYKKLGFKIQGNYRISYFFE